MNIAETLQRWTGYLKNTEKELKDAEHLYNEVKTILGKGIEKKYKPLELALQEYESMDGIQMAYGYGFISSKKYDKLQALHEERQQDVVGKFLDGFCQEWERRISKLKADRDMALIRIEVLKAEKEEGYESLSDEGTES